MKKNDSNSRGNSRYEAILQASNNGQLWGIDISRSKQTKLTNLNVY